MLMRKKKEIDKKVSKKIEFSSMHDCCLIRSFRFISAHGSCFFWFGVKGWLVMWIGVSQS